MSEIFISLLILVIGAAIGAFISSRFTSLKNKSETSKLEADILNTEEQKNSLKNQVSEALNNLELMRNEKDLFKDQLTTRSLELKNMEQKLSEQKEDLEKIQEKFTTEFENLANKILEKKSEKFTEQNKQNLDNLLNPLQKKIESFEKKVETSQKESFGMHSALKQQLEGLKDLNQKMSKETTNLTKALKGDSKMQGSWGELVLERVLQKSGLEKDREYFVQQSFTLEDGSRVLPDVVSHLPDNKKMIIDSKVSLTDYNRYINSENDNEKEAYLKAHINSINKHVDQLSEKNYQDLYEIESPDFVLLFIPIEPAFAVALNNDNSLYNKAFEKNIVIVTPSTLLATLRTIDSMWNNEKQQQNALEIAKLAGRLYDQFVNLTNDLIKVGNQLKTVQGSYDVTMKKLTGKGNLITKVENIKKLGIKQKKHFNDKLLERSKEED
jgi:DNA recombination protein RmuC